MVQTAAIIDYGSGNLRSVAKAFERAARETGAAVSVRVTDDPETIAGSDRVILPGVGAFAACMDGLSARAGVIEALEHAALVEGRPFLGICVGMQLLADRGLEFGTHQGLSWIPGEVRAIEPDSADLSVPHMGWNIVTADAGPMVEALDGASFYFAHSYHFAPENEMHAQGFTEHGQKLVAAVGRDNLFGVQFHPEKSQAAGLDLIAAFLGWDP